MSFKSSPHTTLLRMSKIYEELDKTVGLVNIERLHNEETRIKNLVTQFKNNDEEYLKIKRTVKKKLVVF
ncbi:MAG TPA: hypothetical protein VKA98_04570 [Nitrososphaeraceae archaeon]|nr:hypothetical protein [Nitrososphaeraceae archaeon]